MRNWIILVLFSLLFTSGGCKNQLEIFGDYSTRTGPGREILRVDSSSVICISYFAIGDGYSIHLGTFKLRGRTIVFILDDYFPVTGFPTRWEKDSKFKLKYRVSEDGNFISKGYPHYILYRSDSLSKDQVELLEIAPSLVEKYPYP